MKNCNKCKNCCAYDEGELENGEELWEMNCEITKDWWRETDFEEEDRTDIAENCIYYKER